MKNIEKYPNTADAREAWKKYSRAHLVGLGLASWLDEEYVETREPTLLEAAEKVIEFLYKSKNENYSISYDDIDKLEAVVAREKSKPIRNVDRYATMQEAIEAYNKMCNSRCCDECALNALYDDYYRCQIKWLYAAADAGKEAAK